MLFCIRLLPVTEQSNWLNTVHERYTTTRKILHLFCVDDLKLVGKQEEEVQKRVQTATWNSDLIRAPIFYSKKEN